jgi:hypothetical protein
MNKKKELVKTGWEHKSLYINNTTMINYVLDHVLFCLMCLSRLILHINHYFCYLGKKQFDFLFFHQKVNLSSIFDRELN